MTKRCAKCRKEMDAELFICPHCGAIYGEPIYKYKRSRKRKNIPLRKLLPVLILVLLIVIAASAFKPMIERFFPDIDPDGNIVTGNYVSYSVQVINQYSAPIEGVVIVFSSANSDDVVQTETDEKGYAYIFHVRDDTLRAEVIGWPTDIDCIKPDPVVFESGTHQVITLQTYAFGVLPYTSTPSLIQPPQRQFTVKVVDTTGTPVKGAKVNAGTQPLPSVSAKQSAFTDENGQCSFVVTGEFNVQLSALPAGYYSDWQIYPIAESDTEVTITVFNTDELQPQEGKAVYTVALRMNSGECVCNASVKLTYMLDGEKRTTYAYTNEDGTVSFLCDRSDDITADVYVIKGSKQYAVQLKFRNGETYIEWIFY